MKDRANMPAWVRCLSRINIDSNLYESYREQPQERVEQHKTWVQSVLGITRPLKGQH